MAGGSARHGKARRGKAWIMAWDGDGRGTRLGGARRGGAWIMAWNKTRRLDMRLRMCIYALAGIAVLLLLSGCGWLRPFPNVF